MADENLLKWIATQYPAVELELKEDETLQTEIRTATEDLRTAVMALVNHAQRPDHSHFELQTLQREIVAVLGQQEVKLLECVLRLNRAKVNLDQLMDSVTLAIRALPQTAPIEMQEHVQRRLNIAIALTNPTLPPGAVDSGEKLFARKSEIF
jgi:hypothetical protein